jgi:hypothetical protein
MCVMSALGPRRVIFGATNTSVAFGAKRTFSEQHFPNRNFMSTRPSAARTMAVSMGAKRSGRGAALRHYRGHRAHPRNPMNQTVWGK